MADLIARLETAPGPDRALDIEIWDTVEAWPKEPTLPDWRTAPNGRPVHAALFAPNYTGSLDDAMALIPEGWFIDLHDWRWCEDPRWNAHVVPRGVSDVTTNGRAPTAAPAVCAAALKARAAG